MRIFFSIVAFLVASNAHAYVCCHRPDEVKRAAPTAEYTSFLKQLNGAQLALELAKQISNIKANCVNGEMTETSGPEVIEDVSGQSPHDLCYIAIGKYIDAKNVALYSKPVKD